MKKSEPNRGNVVAKHMGFPSRDSILLTSRCLGYIVANNSIHADVRVDRDGKAEDKISGLLQHAPLQGVCMEYDSSYCIWALCI